VQLTARQQLEYAIEHGRAVVWSVAVKSRQHCEASECRLETCRRFAHVGQAGGDGGRGIKWQNIGDWSD